MPNNRLFYAAYSLGFSPTTQAGLAFVGASGIQSVGLNTTFALDPVFQLGELDVFDQLENIPNVEMSVEQVLGDYPLVCMLATQGTGQSNTMSLISRFANATCQAAVGFYADTAIAATGVGKDDLVVMSGMYVSNISFTFPVEGNSTHSCTLVGNNKEWSTALTEFPNAGFGTLPGTGIQRRQSLTSATLPSNLPNGNSLTSNRIQNISVSSDFGRPEIFQLGTKAPYCRYMEFPVEVTTTIEVLDLAGDKVVASSTVANTSTVDQAISLTFDTGLVLNLGSSNRLLSVTSQGGDTSGGNRTTTFNYRNYNSLTITDPVLT